MEEPKINQEDVPIHPSNGGPPSRYVGGGVCAKCGALRGYWAYEGDPDCRSCNDQGELPFDLNKKFDHPWWGEEDVTFWNSFMGFDTVADPKRTWQDPRSTECHQKNKLRHFLRHGCCPGCHKYAEQFQEGQAVDRGLNYHFERGECYQWGLIREPGCKKCGADRVRLESVLGVRTKDITKVFWLKSTTIRSIQIRTKSSSTPSSAMTSTSKENGMSKKTPRKSTSVVSG